MKEEYIANRVRDLLRRKLCNDATCGFTLGDCEFDVLGYSRDKKTCYIVECKKGSDRTTIGQTFGQLMAYEELVSENGYELVNKLAKTFKSFEAETIHQVMQEKKMTFQFYVAFLHDACKRRDLLDSIRRDLPFIGVIDSTKNEVVYESKPKQIPIYKKYRSHSDFLDGIKDKLTYRLSDELKEGLEMELNPAFRFLKVWYSEWGTKRLHFEVRPRKVIEIGLHFEWDEKKKNDDTCNYFMKRRKSITKKLGTEIKKGGFPKRREWRRIYIEIEKPDKLTSETADPVADKLRDFVIALKPVIANALSALNPSLSRS